MGCCCSSKEESSNGGGGAVSETEMREHETANRKVLAIARAMSAPSIEVPDNDTKVCVCVNFSVQEKTLSA